jgi:predicted acyl esterase
MAAATARAWETLRGPAVVRATAGPPAPLDPGEKPAMPKLDRLAALALLALAALPVAAQQKRAPMTPEETAKLIAKRNDIEQELEKLAVIQRKLMIPMRDGKRMQADVYYPKQGPGRYPVIFVRTPYNFNWWDVKLGAPRDMTGELTAIKKGYAFVEMQERGHYFSEGNYEILGTPLSDGADEIEWMGSQPWSNGKVGTTGCSSTAEWQLAVVSQAPKGYAAFNVQGFGAGIGRVGGFYEQGNWYRGGAFQMLFAPWIAGEQNQVRPMFPADATSAQLEAASRMFDLAPSMPPVDWGKALWHLPVQDLIAAVGGPHGQFADAMPIPTGGRMIQRTPNDPAWAKGGLWRDDMPVDLPGLWFVSWYDVSQGPNLAAYNWVRSHAKGAAAEQQYLVIAPTLHCAYKRAKEHTVVGERDLGDARYPYDDLVYGFFDKFLKGVDSPVLAKQPKVTYYTMGANQWRTADTWPPKGVEPLTFYLASDGKANTLHGDGRLLPAAPAKDHADRFTYDPLHPVPTLGGGFCCMGTGEPGAMDQSKQEAAREDILVYTSEPFAQDTELTGNIETTLYVSSDVKDTDVTVKLVDVYPDGKAYNLDDTIQRLRYRNGYDKPSEPMKPGKVYKVTFSPMVTSNLFPAGHRLRIEVSGSNFPRFDRNLNTGGHNYDEDKPVVAHTKIHHSAEHPSSVTVSVLRH